MKKYIALLLALVMCLSFCACGKSEEAQAADDKIAAIGTVTLDSGAAIDAANAAVDALEEKDKAALDNLNALTDAVKTYSELVIADEAAKVDEVIAAIGTVTLDSGEAIEAAKAAYEGCSSEAKALVKSADAITAAEDEYKALVAADEAAKADAVIAAIGTVTLESGEAIEAAKAALAALSPEAAALVADAGAVDAAEAEFKGLQAARAAELIDAIGTVTVDSGALIDEAQAYFDTLPDDVAALVANADALEAAATAYEDAQRAAAEKLLGSMRLSEDRVRGMKFYYPSAFPYYSDYWGADVRCFALPYIGMDDESIWLRLVCDYTADDWVFFDSIIFSVDGDNTTKRFNYFDVTRDNGGGDVWEYVDIDVGSSEIDLLWSIVNSTETIIRFQGDDWHHDFTVRASDKEAIKQVLTVYEYYDSVM